MRSRDAGRGKNQGRCSLLFQAAIGRVRPIRKKVTQAEEGSGVRTSDSEVPVPGESQAARRQWIDGSGDTHKLSSI